MVAYNLLQEHIQFHTFNSELEPMFESEAYDKDSIFKDMRIVKSAESFGNIESFSKVFEPNKSKSIIDSISGFPRIGKCGLFVYRDMADFLIHQNAYIAKGTYLYVPTDGTLHGMVKDTLVVSSPMIEYYIHSKAVYDTSVIHLSELANRHLLYSIKC